MAASSRSRVGHLGAGNIRVWFALERVLLVIVSVVMSAASSTRSARAQGDGAGRARAPSTATAAGGASVFGVEPRVDRLPNGLTVISIRTESSGIVAYDTLVRVGSRDEVEPGHSGYAHLFEHMMFRGTERHPRDEYERLLQGFGADNNAFTTDDYTLYTITAPSSVLDRVVEIEADRFMRLSYDEASYRTETGAVRGEYDTSASDPSLKMWETLSELGFRRHTYGHTTLGYLRDIDAMPSQYAYSRGFFRRFYTPDDCTLIVAGDVDHDALMTRVRAAYGAWRGRRAATPVPDEPEPTAGATRHVAWPAETSPRMLIGWRTPAFVAGRSDADRDRALRDTAALRIVHGLLFSEPSPLYQRLVVEERRLLELGSSADDIARDPHLLVASATLAEGQPFDAILADIQTAVDALGGGGVDPVWVAAVQSHVRYELLTALETPSDVAERAAQLVGVSGELAYLDRYLRALAAVTREDIARVARTYLGARRRFVVTLSHGEPRPPS